MDFVRLETASALKRDIPVIPVLVHGALMPRADQLPEDLNNLAYRNAVELTHARWESDVQVLIKALNPYVESVQKKAGVAEIAPATGPTDVKKRWPRIVGAALAAIVVAAGGYAWYRTSSKTTWASYDFPAPNAGLMAFTIMPDGNPACASYDGGACLWGVSAEQIDFSRLKPLVCGEQHLARWGVTGYEDPKHWCNVAKKVRVRTSGALPRHTAKQRA
jgi:hypothetical protein